MLILDRNNHQTLNIGDDITIEVLEVNGLQVRLGITAPKETVVVREELLRRNSSCLKKGLTNRQSLQQVIMQSNDVDTETPPNTAATQPKVTYKRRKTLTYP